MLVCIKVCQGILVFCLIKYSTGMLYAIVLYVRPTVLYVCLSVRLSVFTITQERLDVEWWKFGDIRLRSRVTWSSKMGHVYAWPLTRPNWRFYIMHVYRSAYKGIYSVNVYIHRIHSCVIIFPVEYLHICATAVAVTAYLGYTYM